MRFKDCIVNAATGAWDVLKEHSHTVMAIGAVAGLAGSIILTYKKAPKIRAIVDEQREKMEIVEVKADHQEITEEEYKKERKEITKETVKRLAPEVGPIVALSLGTSGLMIGSAVVSEMKLGHVRDLLSISEIYNKELTDKMNEELGEEKTKEIKNKIAEDHAANYFNEKGEEWEKYVLQARGGGHDLYWDELVGRMFFCDDVTIRNAVLRVNERIINRMEWMPLSSIYSELGLPYGSVAKGIGAGGMYCKIPSYELNLNGAIKCPNDKPATVFNFNMLPMPEDLAHRDY